ncbi:MAG: hypothetical protein ACR2Q4_24970 [Geminicoccaceae bacterium]
MTTGAFADESERPVIAVQKALFGDIGERAKERFDETAFLTSIERALKNTRKFRIATRDQAKLKVLREEQKFSKSAASAGNAAAEGQLLAADYVVVPTVLRFGFSRSHRHMPNIDGKYFRAEQGALEVATEVIDSASGETVGTYHLEDGFSTKETVVNSRGGQPSAARFTAMTDAVGQALADQLISTVFPMKVVAVTNGQIYINRGADGGLSLGDILEVFRVGPELVDPDTGEFLGVVEDRLGKLKIIDVKPKVAIAETVSVTGDVTKLDIVRKP